ncbi:MAG: hypothetical protein IKP50_00155 [Bacilli bacterium]|nr:hypothetical protein [Bacilli bacterium]
MSFDLYLASADDAKIIDYMYENDYPLLYSQLNNRNYILKHFAAQEQNITHGKLLVDSGAHSAHTKGVKLDLEEYIGFVNDNIDKMSLYVQVDKIPGVYRKPKTAKDWLEAPQLSWENYLYMKEKSKDWTKLVPVFHQGEDYKWLENLCDYEFSDGSHIPYIGLSPRGDVSLQAKYDFCAKCFAVIQKSKNPKVKTHAFGATSLSMLERLPFTSADSTTWVLVSAFGQVWIPTGITGESVDDTVGVKLGVSKENINHQTATWTYWEQKPEIKKKLDDYFESIGTNIEKLSESHSERSLASAKFCQNWAKNYQYKGLEKFTSVKSLF